MGNPASHRARTVDDGGHGELTAQAVKESMARVKREGVSR